MPKDSERLRRIISPIPDIGRTASTSVSTATLPSVFDLCAALAGPYPIEVLDDGSLIIIISFRFLPRGLPGTTSPCVCRPRLRWFQVQLASGAVSVVPCFRSLAMGASWAVELAQHADENLLRRAGVRREVETVRGGQRLPRSGFHRSCASTTTWASVSEAGLRGDDRSGR